MYAGAQSLLYSKMKIALVDGRPIKFRGRPDRSRKTILSSMGDLSAESDTHEMADFHPNEEIMAIGKYVVLSLAIAGCTVAAYAIGRRTRHLERRQLRQDVHDWEQEGGHPAATETPVVASPTTAASVLP